MSNGGIPGIPESGMADSYATGAPQRAPWSAAAVTGFILSFLGCTIIGGVLGLILGVVGIVRTRGAVRRGRGLAIAAIPISLAMGCGGAVILVGMLQFSQMASFRTELPKILGADAQSAEAAADALLEHVSDGLRSAVTKEQTQAWIETVWQKQGRLASVDMDKKTPGGQSTGGNVFLNFEGKFVNGVSNIKITYLVASMFGRPLVDDIEVDGVSLRPTS